MHNYILRFYDNGFHQRNGGFLKNGFAVSYDRTEGTRKPEYSYCKEDDEMTCKKRSKWLCHCIYDEIYPLYTQGSGFFEGRFFVTITNHKHGLVKLTAYHTAEGLEVVLEEIAPCKYDHIRWDSLSVSPIILHKWQYAQYYNIFNDRLSETFIDLYGIGENYLRAFTKKGEACVISLYESEPYVQK